MIVTVSQFNEYTGNFEDSESTLALKNTILSASQELVSEYLRFDPEERWGQSVPDLVRLTVIRCGLSGTVDLGEMPLLASLDLSDNYIEALRGDFPQLTYLKLANNEIKTIDAVDIPQSTEELVLSGNPLESLDGLEQFDNIYKLKLYHTDIKDLSALKEMKGLTALYIDKEDMNSDLEFLYDDFRNGDNDRKRELISRIYTIE